MSVTARAVPPIVSAGEPALLELTVEHSGAGGPALELGRPSRDRRETLLGSRSAGEDRRGAPRPRRPRPGRFRASHRKARASSMPGPTRPPSPILSAWRADAFASCRAGRCVVLPRVEPLPAVVPDGLGSARAPNRTLGCRATRQRELDASPLRPGRRPPAGSLAHHGASRRTHGPRGRRPRRPGQSRDDGAARRRGRRRTPPTSSTGPSRSPPASSRPRPEDPGVGPYAACRLVTTTGLDSGPVRGAGRPPIRARLPGRPQTGAGPGGRQVLGCSSRGSGGRGDTTRCWWSWALSGRPDLIRPCWRTSPLATRGRRRPRRRRRPALSTLRRATGARRSIPTRRLAGIGLGRADTRLRPRAPPADGAAPPGRLARRSLGDRDSEAVPATVTPSALAARAGRSARDGLDGARARGPGRGGILGALFHRPGRAHRRARDPYPGAPRRPGSTSRARRPATDLVGPRRLRRRRSSPLAMVLGSGLFSALPRPGRLARPRHGSPAGLASFLHRHRTGARAAGPRAGARVGGGRGRACLPSCCPRPAKMPAAFGLLPALGLYLFSSALGRGSWSVIGLAPWPARPAGTWSLPPAGTKRPARACARSVGPGRATRRVAGRGARRARAMLVRVCVLAAVAAAVIGPNLPGARSAALVAWHGGRRTSNAGPTGSRLRWRRERQRASRSARSSRSPRRRSTIPPWPCSPCTAPAPPGR